MESRTVKQWHTEKAQQGGNNTIFAAVLHYDEELRYAKVTEKKTNTVIEKPVYRVWLSDGTAIIEISFWSALAEQVRNELIGRRNSFDSGEMVVMTIKKFAVGRDPRAWLVPQRRLTASDTASVETREATSEESARFM